MYIYGSGQPYAYALPLTQATCLVHQPHKHPRSRTLVGPPAPPALQGSTVEAALGLTPTAATQGLTPAAVTTQDLTPAAAIVGQAVVSARIKRTVGL